MALPPFRSQASAKNHLTAWNLGYVYYRLRKYRDAVESVRNALRLRSDDVEGQFFLGNLYVLTKNRKLALEQLNVLKTLNRELANRLYQSIYADRVITVLYGTPAMK